MSNFGFGPHSPGDHEGDDRENSRDDGRKGSHGDGGTSGSGGTSGKNGGGDGHNGANGDGRPGGFGGFPGFPGFPGMGAPGAGMGGAMGGAFSGNLGDILNQFGAMISGFGADANNSDAKDPVNYAMAERLARQQIASAPGPKPNDSQAVAEATRLAELWLDEATALPAGATGSVAFGPTQWLEETLPTWKRIISPLARKLSEAAINGFPEQLQQGMPGMPGADADGASPFGGALNLGPLTNIMRQAHSMNFGMQLGRTLGELAKGVVVSTQWGMPLAEGRVAAVATAHLKDMAQKLGADQRETLIYLAAREAAHLRLFQHVPWLVERLILDVEEFAAGLGIDNSAVEEATREFNPEMLNDPQALQDMMQRLQGQDLSPKVVSSNAHARERLEVSLSLVEGWVDFVVGDALGRRMPGTAMLGEAWASFREKGSPEMTALTDAVGISLAAPLASEAADLWRRLHEAVGTERRDAVWNHPDFLPVKEDLENPAAFVGKIAFDEDEMGTFDPIAEIEKLEQKEREAAEGKQPDAGTGGTDGNEPGPAAEGPGESTGKDAPEDGEPEGR